MQPEEEQIGPAKSLAVGLEIGGTKIQAGLGSPDGRLLKVVRKQVKPEHGAAGIRRDLISMVEELLASSNHRISDVQRIGIGFGGPVDAGRGMVITSYQIQGWDRFPLKEWSEKQWGKPVIVLNDASVAGLAESLHGSGRGCSRIFYITLGSGVGGGWIVDQQIDDGQGLGAEEIGHTLVPDPDGAGPVELEQVCSGWSIARRARAAAKDHGSWMVELAGSVDKIDAKVVYAAAEQGDRVAGRILEETVQALGIAISNLIALLHPERVVVGGGVSLMGPLFWNAIQQEVQRRAMPAFLSRTEVVKAGLGEEVVVIGALCLK